MLLVVWLLDEERCTEEGVGYGGIRLRQEGISTSKDGDRGLWTPIRFYPPSPCSLRIILVDRPMTDAWNPDHCASTIPFDSMLGSAISFERWRELLLES